MITLIILIGLIAIGKELIDKHYYRIGVIMCVLFSVWMVIHVLAVSFVSYEYKIYCEKRNVYENALIQSISNGNEYQTALIEKDVVLLNIELSKYKLNNKMFYLGQYIDDRFELLTPIKLNKQNE